MSNTPNQQEGEVVSFIYLWVKAFWWKEQSMREWNDVKNNNNNKEIERSSTTTTLQTIISVPNKQRWWRDGERERVTVWQSGWLGWDQVSTSTTPTSQSKATSAFYWFTQQHFFFSLEMVGPDRLGPRDWTSNGAQKGFRKHWQYSFPMKKAMAHGKRRWEPSTH